MYRRHRVDPRAWFTPEEIERSRSYRRAPRRVARAESVLLLAGLAALIAGRAAPHLLRAAGINAWPGQVVAVTSALLVATSALGVPFGLWRLRHERRWDFSRQRARGWIGDRVKGLALSLVLLDGVALGFVALARATPAWWLFAWLAASALSLVMVMVAPLVLAPLFNTFRPLEDPALVDATRELGRRVGVDIRQVLVMDASRRTAKHNAYFTGLGRTKRVVLWDTLLSDFGPPATLAVLAHELGHWRRRHLPKMLALTSAVMLPATLVLRALLGAPAVQHATGTHGPGDPAALPLAAGAVLVLQVAWLPVAAWLSRAWERQADTDSVMLTGDPAAFVAMQRELAVRNLSDVAPTWPAYLLASHPPAPERMAWAVRR